MIQMYPPVSLKRAAFFAEDGMVREVFTDGGNDHIFAARSVSSLTSCSSSVQR